MLRKYLLRVLLIFIFPGLYATEEPLKPYKTQEPPVIDGVLDDAVWRRAPAVSDFKSFIPDFGKDMPFKTIVYMAYDSETLYFAYRCYDEEPSKIKASVNSRDNILNDDWVCINLLPC